MHNVIWSFLRLAWLALSLGYFVLYLATAGRLRDPERKRIADRLFWAIAVLAGIRMVDRYVFHWVLFYQYALVVGGFAAGIGILFQTWALVTQDAPNSEERAWPPKLLG
jgi:hypothetical protein